MKEYPFFYVSRYDDAVEEVKAVKHSAKSVWIKRTGFTLVGPRETVDKRSLRTSWGIYFETRAEAARYLRERLTEKVSHLTTALADAKHALANLK